MERKRFINHHIGFFKHTEIFAQFVIFPRFLCNFKKNSGFPMLKNKVLFLLCLLMSSTAFSQFPNVMIGASYMPEEPSIAINPKNPGQLVAGANINLFYTSVDGGLSWLEGGLTSNYGVMGDPCLLVDTAGNYYYFHLSDPPLGTWIDRIVCQKSTDGGLNWSDGTYMGLNGTKAQDKEWAAVDPQTNNISRYPADSFGRAPC
jgi:hypothetical protein